MKTSEELFEYLKSHFGEEALEFEAEAKMEPWINVEAGRIYDLCKMLRDDEQLDFNYLMCLSGVHYPKEEMLGVTYHLNSTTLGHKLTLKVKVPQDDPKIPSIEKIWKTADWHEREAYDMYGIIFEGHPDLSRILCPDDWEGHPLRKDYEYPEFYQGIKVSY